MKLVEPTKMCGNPDCGRHLPLSDFYARSSAPDGRQSWCKSCSREKRAQWAKDNPTRIRRLWEETHQRRMNDPERASIERVRKREWERVARGTLPENYRTSPYMRCEGPDRATVTAEPFGAWLSEIIDRDESTYAATALRLGLAERTVRACCLGEQVGVELATVERALIADGTTMLWEIYGDLFEEAA